MAKLSQFTSFWPQDLFQIGSYNLQHSTDIITQSSLSRHGYILGQLGMRPTVKLKITQKIAFHPYCAYVRGVGC